MIRENYFEAPSGLLELVDKHYTENQLNLGRSLIPDI